MRPYASPHAPGSGSGIRCIRMPTGESLHAWLHHPPGRVKEFTFKGGSGSYSKFFDGTEKLLGLDNFLWINRSSIPTSNGQRDSHRNSPKTDPEGRRWGHYP